MIGRRVRDLEPHQFEPGDFGRWEAGGGWYACTPNDLTANLTAHQVIEHEDGTITVSPSIEVGRLRPERGYWHGFLERGVWRSC
jgi:hypothetical protein